jgi:hypothetical protein
MSSPDEVVELTVVVQMQANLPAPIVRNLLLELSALLVEQLSVTLPPIIQEQTVTL